MTFPFTWSAEIFAKGWNPLSRKTTKMAKNTAGDVKYFYSDLEISALVVEWL